MDTSAHSSTLIEGCVVGDPFGGRFEDYVAVHPAGRFAEMSRNPAVVWAVARGDHDEDRFIANDGCEWSIRRAAIPD